MKRMIMYLSLLFSTIFLSTSICFEQTPLTNLDSPRRIRIFQDGWGWWTGHNFFMDSLRIENNGVVFDDYFDDNSIDLSKWTPAGNTVIEQSQVMQIFTNQTDNGGYVNSKWIDINPNYPLIIERKCRAHYSNSYHISHFRVRWENDPIMEFGIDYGNMIYSGAGLIPVIGTAITRYGTSAHQINDTSNVSRNHPMIWDNWFKEKIIYYPITGNLEYYVNNVLITIFNVGKLPDVPGLVAHYDFYENLLDKSGLNNNGVANGNVIFTNDRFGNQNSAIYLDGQASFIDVPNSLSLRSARHWLTMSGWIKFDSDHPAVSGIIQKSNSTNYGQYGLSIEHTNNKLFARFNNGYGYGITYQFQPDQWYFVAAVFYADNSIKLFVNDQIIGQMTPSFHITYDEKPLSIGRDTPNELEYLKGFLDDIRIYNRALSEEEISELYHENGWSVAKTPVIFITGIMGSPLYNDNDPNDNHLTEGERIWLDKSKFLLGIGDEFLDVLQLDQFGNDSLNTSFNIKVAPLRNDLPNNLEFQYGGVFLGRLPFSKYRGFFEGLIDSQYTLDDGDYNDTEGEDLYCFTYDWRKSIIYNSNLLSIFIDSVKSRTSSEKVNLVAHSMGGMVAKECIKEFGTDRIKKLIFIGTPHLGSPKILYTSLTGDPIFPFTWIFNKKEIQKISLNMSSPYLLFPNEKYRDISLHNGIPNNGVSLYSFCFWENDNIPLNYFQTQQYFKETVLPDSRRFNSYLLNQADLFQQSSLETDFGQIEVYNIVGSATPTIGYIFDKINGNEHKPDPWYNLVGDGTVPLRSAEMVSLTKKIADYYIESVEHSDLPANSQVVSIVLDLLKEPAVTYFNTPPVSYGTTTLQIKAGSPVELHAYDSQNRHTGSTSDSTWVTDIPGSFYISNNLADTTSPKVILLPKGDMYSIKLLSQNTVSTFDLSIKDINNGQNTIEATFLNIPVLSNTLATCSFDSLSENIELDLDWDGNGIIDTVFTPTIVTDLKDNIINKLPSNYYLGQNYPNPFNPMTKINYSIPQIGFVTLKVYDILGREVAVLVNEEKSSGIYEVEFNASSLASGIYYYHLRAGAFSSTRKFVLLK